MQVLTKDIRCRHPGLDQRLPDAPGAWREGDEVWLFWSVREGMEDHQAFLRCGALLLPKNRLPAGGVIQAGALASIAA